ncbi:hypothetical protein JCM8097_009192 [Rhodosporidiobolus ruineniae]
MSRAFSPPLVTDNAQRLDYATHLLKLTPPRDTGARPLAVLLFLLDALPFVNHADKARGDGKRPISSINALKARSPSPVNEHERIHSTSGVSGAPADPRQQQSDASEGPPGWNDWVDYLAETYLYPFPSEHGSPDASSSARSGPHPWTSPLHLPQDVASYLYHLPSSPVFDDSTRTLLLAACRSAITYLSPVVSPSQSPIPSTSQTTLDMLMTEVSSPEFPRPLPSSTVSSIARVLAAQRKAGTASTSSPAVSREVISTLLHHYVSPTFQQRTDESGKISYADRKQDDRLIKAVFPSPDDPPRSATSAGGDTDEDDADTRSINTGIREAHESIARKENKLRQLLGDHWQTGGAQSPTAAAPSPASSPAGGAKGKWAARGAAAGLASQTSSRGTVRPQTSMSTLRRRSSFDSDTSGPSRASLAGEGGDETPSDRQHHRLVSTSSSQSPLIAESPRSPTRAGGFHRRGYSTQSAFAASSAPPAALNLAALARPGAPPLSPAVPTPDLQPDHLSPSAAGIKPFQDLAPAVPSSSPSFAAASGVRVGPPSPRRTSLDSSLDYVYGAPRATLSGGSRLPMNRNALSAHEKRELVRRSKKLEGFFGATFQEAAAQRVLVDGRGRDGGVSPVQEGGGSGAGTPMEPVSPTNTSFPPPVIPSSASSPSPSPSPSSTPARQPTSTSSASARRPSLAPPSSHHFSVPSPSYQFGTSAAARRPSVLSHSSSISSLGGYSPSRSPARTPHGSVSSTASAHAGGVRMHRSSSSPSRRSSSFSSLASPDYAYFSLEPRRMSTFEREEQRREREERRRKLEKVRRMLGERVPVQLVVGGEEEAKSVPMGKSRSAGGFGGLLKGVAGVKLGAGDGGAKGKPKEPVAGGGNAGWTYVEPEMEARASSSSPPGGVGGARPASALGGHGRQGVEALTRARKLENLFGDLPPQSLYLSPQASSSAAAPPGFSSLSARHRRSVSDLTAQASSPSRTPAFDPFSAPSPSPSPAPIPTPTVNALRRWTTTSTVESYRQSIASLGYIAERDPAALDDIARVYTEQQQQHERRRASAGSSLAGPPSVAIDEEYEEDEEEEPTPSIAPTEETETQKHEAPGMQRSASASSHRAVRQAQKLTQFFGTTRGEVWQMLLDDIQASIEDDPSLDEDEREEVLGGVERLRARARV